jgi:DHA1 family tetracycline resistance protein-like MFS transporter
MGSFFGEPFWGKLSDRIGRRPILISTLVCNGLTFLCLAFAPNIYVAFVVRLLGGLVAGNNSVVQAYIVDVTPPDLRASRMSKLGAAFNIGFIVGPFVGGVLARPSAGPLGFQLPLLCAAALGGLSALGVTLFVRESRVRNQVAHRAPNRWVMFGFAARHPVVGRLMLLTFVVGLAFTGIESTFALWAHHRFNWQPRDVGICFGVAGGAAAFSQFFVTGPLSRRYGEAPMLAVGMAGTVICMALQPWSDGRLSTIVLMAGIALFQSVAFPNASALMSRNIDESHQGQVMGLNNAAGAFARFVGPQCAALVFSGLSVNGPFYMGALIVAPAIFLALSAGRAAKRNHAGAFAVSLD